MKRLTFLKSLLILPLVPLSALASKSRDNKSEYQKCHDRLHGAAEAEGLTPKETDWFIKELLKVEPRGDIAGNLGKVFIVRHARYGDENKNIKLGFIGQVVLIATKHYRYPDSFGDSWLQKYSGTFNLRFTKVLLSHIYEMKMKNADVLAVSNT